MTASIGRTPRPAREVKAEQVLDEALLTREGFVLRGIEPAKGGGMVAIVVNGEKRIMHLGRDKADAMFGLAHYMTLPVGR